MVIITATTCSRNCTIRSINHQHHHHDYCGNIVTSLSTSSSSSSSSPKDSYHYTNHSSSQKPSQQQQQQRRQCQQRITILPKVTIIASSSSSSTCSKRQQHKELQVYSNHHHHYHYHPSLSFNITDTNYAIPVTTEKDNNSIKKTKARNIIYTKMMILFTIILFIKCFTDHMVKSHNNNTTIIDSKFRKDSSYIVLLLEMLGLRTPNITYIILHQRPEKYHSITSSSSSFTTNDENENNNNNYNNNNNNKNTIIMNHKIPHILIFTHHINLLTTNLHDDIIYDPNDRLYHHTTSTIVTNHENNNNNHHNNNNETILVPIHQSHHRTYTKSMLTELRALQQNVHRIIELHTTTTTEATTSSSSLLDNHDDDNTYTKNQNNHNNETTGTTTTTTISAVRFLTDQDCINSIHQWAHMSQKHNHTRFIYQTNVPNLYPKTTYNNNNNINHTKNHTTTMDDPNAIANELIEYFHNEPMGMYKADICRGVALYETGGVYMDVDLGIRMNVFPLFAPTSEFITVYGTTERNLHGNFFQAFIAVVPYHDVIHRYIELFILYYRNVIQIGTNDLIGITLLRRAYDEIQVEQELILQYNNYQKQQQEQHETKYETNNSTLSISTTESNKSSLLKTTTTTTTTTRTTNVVTHLQQTTELWQEILYKRHYQYNILSHVPRPTWGHLRLICKFIVVIPPPSIIKHEQQQDTTTNRTTDSKLIVPMYSRIAGSRMCP